MREKTIKKTVSIEGIGLHSGKKGRIILSPLPLESGIIFKDLHTKEEIKASLENVRSTKRGIVLAKGDTEVQTPEHLLATLYVMGISNLLIEYENEIPALDGSAYPFVELIKDAGIISQERERDVCKVKKPIFLRNNGKVLIAMPSSYLRVRYLIDYPDTYIESQYYDFIYDEKLFTKDISKAKTFGLYEEVEVLRKAGLSLGGSLENAIVVNGKKVMGKISLKREFVKHKIIDFLGDISLLNKVVLGDFVLIKTGHSMHIEIAKKISMIGGKYA